MQQKAVGKYLVGEVFASGGMATLHLGRLSGPRGFSRTVAIKRLHSELARDRELCDALATEAHLAARIRHPNVVSVLDVIEEKDELGLVMDLVTGVPLSTLVTRAREAGRRIPAGVAVAIVSGVLRGLHAAHELPDPVVHRDVSPQNVLVDDQGGTRLVDFGIAKIQSSATRGTSLRGKPAYMAPEQLRGEPVDRRTDVWAASVVLWELLTGSRLFSGEADHAVMHKVLERRIDSPDRIVRDLPAELCAATLRGLSRDPDERFATALEMAEVLERSARPATAAEVGALVAELCAPELDAIRQRIADFESQRPRVEPFGWKTILLIIAGVSIAGGLVIGLVIEPAFEPKAEAPSASPPAPSISAPPSASAPAPVASVAEAGAAPRMPTPGPQPPRPRPAEPTPDCDPPYVIDSEGFQRMKPECL